MHRPTNLAFGPRPHSGASPGRTGPVTVSFSIARRPRDEGGGWAAVATPERGWPLRARGPRPRKTPRTNARPPCLAGSGRRPRRRGRGGRRPRGMGRVREPRRAPPARSSRRRASRQPAHVGLWLRSDSSEKAVGEAARLERDLQLCPAARSDYRSEGYARRCLNLRVPTLTRR